MSLGDEGKQAPVILLVDDDTDDRLLIRAALEQCGFAVVEAEDGVQGVAAFEARRPDCVILDLRMPGMDGVEMFRRMKEAGESGETRGSGEVQLQVDGPSPGDPTTPGRFLGSHAPARRASPAGPVQRGC